VIVATHTRRSKRNGLSRQLQSTRPHARTQRLRHLRSRCCGVATGAPRRFPYHCDDDDDDARVCVVGNIAHKRSQK
jgi:hypothetical protein